MKFEVGKYYRARSGRVWRVVGRNNGPWSIIVEGRFYSDEISKACFREDGRFNMAGESPHDIIEEAPAPLKLEVGKAYRDRGGRIWEITGPSRMRLWPFMAQRRGQPDTLMTFREDGRFGDRDQELDLIEEAKENVMPIRIEVGKKYRSRDGCVWTVLREDPSAGGAYPIIAECKEHGLNTFRRSGQFGIFIHQCDLIEEVENKAMVKPKIEVKQTTRTTSTLNLTGAEIVELLQQGGFNVPSGASVTIKVPRDRPLGTAFYVSTSLPVIVSWTEDSVG